MSEENVAAPAVEEPIAPIVEDAEIQPEIETEVPAQEEELSAEEEAELEAMIDESLEDGDSNEEIKEMIETFKFKANGKEKEVVLDWNNKEDIIRRLQLAEAAQPAMQKASEYEKTIDQDRKRLQEDPWAILEELGLDADTLAEERIQNRINQMKKTPEQIAQEKMEAELNELRGKFKKEQEAKEEENYKRLQMEQEKEISEQIETAIDATTQLSRSPYVVKRIADTMLYAMDKGYNDVTAQQVAPLVEKEIREEIRSMMDNMPTELMEEFMGKNAMEKLRKNRLSRAKSIKTAKKIEEVVKPSESKQEKEEKMSMRDFLKRR